MAHQAPLCPSARCKTGFSLTKCCRACAGCGRKTAMSCNLALPEGSNRWSAVCHESWHASASPALTILGEACIPYMYADAGVFWGWFGGLACLCLLKCCFNVLDGLAQVKACNECQLSCEPPFCVGEPRCLKG